MTFLSFCGHFLNAYLISYCPICSEDFKTNEKKIMSDLDGLARIAMQGKAAKAADQAEARDAAEAIRQWVS